MLATASHQTWTSAFQSEYDFPVILLPPCIKSEHKYFTFNRQDERIINLWINIWGKSKHLFLMCSDNTPFSQSKYLFRNSQNKTTSHLIICHNYAAHCDERISMIYLCHRKRVQLQTWKLLKPMRVSSQWMIKGAKAYQLFLNTETTSCGSGYILPQ